MQNFSFFASCPRGLEQVLTAELTALGALQLVPTDGGVVFAGPWSLLMKANLQSRIASRILWKLEERPYVREDDLYRLALKIDWPALFSVDNTIKVGVTAVKSPLRSTNLAALKVKDAICDRFRQAGGTRPSVDTQEPDMRIQLFLTDRMATIYLDTSGEALFKRGYRVEAVDAPLRENLAAGILALSGWQASEPLYDPMCGSGTFLIEAVLKARNIAPGSRRTFAFQYLRQHDEKAWQALRDEARNAERHDQALQISGSDVSSTALMHAQANLLAAKLDGVVSLKQLNMLDAKAPAVEGVLLTNPPYGIRLDEQDKLLAAYPEWGNVLKQRFAGWRAYFFTADPALAKAIRLKPSKKTPLFNGALECRLLEFKMIAGGNRGHD
ncbi:THUMP domain-containing class I SAM-dependent RNA methyltransferase [Jeongeupia chitinilytica]|uniref:RNA methyltransferase n=1 Tax=Jeongeupia chitinilytica TaxID=1041641 RepID=A0ABQ3H2Q0_9NEIS|nr:THUMP domain-containing protein [Jeongeupia chitinilytica]GHD67330.1 RNA methyltransferase [Jeongeupia chitinilytica]